MACYSLHYAMISKVILYIRSSFPKVTGVFYYMPMMRTQNVPSGPVLFFLS